jgi:signal transduction histidine kinase
MFDLAQKMALYEWHAASCDTEAGNTPQVHMTRRSTTGGNARTLRGGKPKRSIAPKASCNRISSAAAQEAKVARLTRELREALEQQTATGDILKIIASSPDDVQPVFDAIARSANRLVDGCATTVVLRRDDTLHLAAFTATEEASIAFFKRSYPRPISADTEPGRVILEGTLFQVDDAQTDTYVSSHLRDYAQKMGRHSFVYCPMMRGGMSLGSIGVSRKQATPFTPHEIQLLRTFADQAVITISTVELFQRLQERTRELSQSLDDLHTAQNRLVQTEKFAALGRLVAGVAHEISTPVGNSVTVATTFINKTDRLEADVASGNVRRSILNEYIAASREAALQIMANLNHAVDLIQSFKLVATDRNFSDRKVFDLGQVTEQIVRSVRSGLRSHDLTFKVNCQPGLAMNSYPGPYGQVLTNLILNSAAHAFPGEARGSVYIATRALDKDNVEIEISDDGCGMSQEVQRQAFDPFFTTRRHQGRVGLGLHIVYNIVTNRLGGRIDLDTKPGEGTRIRMIVPREAALEIAAHEI